MKDNNVLWSKPKINPTLATYFETTFGWKLSDLYNLNSFNTVLFEHKLQMRHYPPVNDELATWLDWQGNKEMSTDDIVREHYGLLASGFIVAILEWDKSNSVDEMPIARHQTGKFTKYHAICTRDRDCNKIVKVDTKYRNGNFAVHKEYKHYDITHLPTGRRLQRSFNKLKDVKAVVDMLADVVGTDANPLPESVYLEVRSIYLGFDGA